MAFDTAGNIVDDVATELGLIPFTSKPSDPFGSTDPNIGQLCQLLKSCGRNLLREAQWSNLQQIWLFSTVASQGRYALPVDMDRVIGQTEWNRTNRLPISPLSPQQFEFFKARLAGVVFNILYRTLQGKFHAYPDDTTPGGYAIAYEYVSRWWVVPAATTATQGPWLPNVTVIAGNVVNSGGNLYTCAIGGKTSTTAAVAGTGAGIVDGTATWNFTSVAGTDTPTLSTDVIQFDPQLVRAHLKLAWKIEKGFDASAAFADFKDCLGKAIGADVQAPILRLGGSAATDRLLGEQNIPVTGFGR